MKSMMCSFFTVMLSLAAMFVTGSTWADVTPVVVWNSDFDVSSKDGFTVTLGNNAALAGDGSVTLTGKTSGDGHTGVAIDWAPTTFSSKTMTVLVKYSGLNQAETTGNTALLATYWGEAQKAKEILLNKTHTYVKLAYNVTSSAAGDNSTYWTRSLPASGLLRVQYTSAGIRFTFLTGSEGSWTKGTDLDIDCNNKDNLKKDAQFYGLKVGGTIANTGSYYRPSMKVEAVAICDTTLTDNELTAFEFTNSGVEYETLTYNGFLTTTFVDTGWNFDLTKLDECKITGTMSGSSIANRPAASTGYWIEPAASESGVAKFQMQVYQYQKADDHWLKAVEVELKKGNNGNVWMRAVRTGYVDGGLTDPMGSIKITNWNSQLATSETAGGYGVNKVEVKVPTVQVEAIKAEIKTNKKWSELGWETAPTASDKVELTVSANATLTFDKDTAFKSLKLIGQRNLTIAGITSANVALLSKISIGSFTGKLTFEIDASAGFTADDTLKNLIKSAGTQWTFVFKSTVANKGATINYGTSVNTTLNTHIVFNGGTHAFTFGQGEQSKDFGANASNDNPTVWVKGGATLNFTGKDLTGWNGTANANGVIRVDNGATLNFLADGRNTIYYRQRLCLEPGAKVKFPDTTGANDNKPVVRFLGGTAENNEVIYVLPPTGNATTATISGNIFFASDNTHGFGVFVDSNSCLKWTGNMLVYDNNDDKAIVKRGAGVLEYSGTMDGVVQVAAGAIGGNGSFRKLTFGANGALDLNNGAPKITGSIVPATNKQLKLVIDKPTHLMEVITLPAAADKTGWTAIVNGRDAENELIAEGNTLKLKWKEPPTIDVDIDDITIESTSDWNGGTVKIDVSSLTKGDYEGEITYRLKFGDKTVIGSEEGNIAIFKLDEEFKAGNIYRGIFELGYGDAGDKIEAAEVIVYEGKLAYKDKDEWVNETPTTLRSTGTYDPDDGVSVEDGVIKIDTQEEVSFSPTLDPDYADKCDSEFTMTIFASEAVDDDLTVDEGAQAGVMIISDGAGGVEFRFIDGGNEEWAKGPAAELDTDYEVTISFHYAKDEGDSDSVTYTIKQFPDDSYTYAHRPNTADKVTEIIFTDGTRFKSLIGTCQIEIADPVAQGIKPGEEQEITAADDDEAQEKAAKIPVMIPEDDAVIEALNTDEKKNAYKALFKVVAVKKNGAYIAEVIFAEPAISAIKEDEEKILSEVVSALSSLIGEEGELENIKGRPGLYYGIAADGELVNMGEAQPDEWKIAGADGDIVGLKVKKAASAKQGFYKVICTPIKPEK